MVLLSFGLMSVQPEAVLWGDMAKYFCPGSIQPFYGTIIRGSRNDWNQEIMPVFADPYWKC